jgi:uncharacterized membrane protein YoaK (UPF0700 family)
METMALPLASAALFTLGCAILQTFRQYAEQITPVLVSLVALLVIAILVVFSVQYHLAHGGDVLLADPWMSAVL